MGHGMRRWRLRLWVGLCGGLVLLAGTNCGQKVPEQKAPAEAEGFETSLTGHLSKTYEGDYDLCLTATRAALRKLALSVVEESGGIFKKSLEVESEDGTSVLVQVGGLTKDSTRVSVKVGYFFGDRYAARRIHSEIEGEVTGRRTAAKEMQRKWGGTGAGATTTTSLPAR